MLSRSLIAAAGNAAEDVSWDLAYAYFSDTQPGLFELASTTTGWNSTGIPVSQTTTPEGVFVSPDGMTLYVCGQNGSNQSCVFQYSLSPTWQVNTLSYVQLLNVGSSFTVHDLFFKPDGTKMYLINSVANRIYEYPLSTAWDVTTAGSFSSSPAYVNNSIRLLEGLYFSPDGTKMYTCGMNGGSGSDAQIDEYTLSTAWDVTTAGGWQRVLTASITSVNGQEILPMSLSFSSDGTSMFLIGRTNTKIYQFSLSTAWDVTTAGSDIYRYSINIYQTVPTGLFINPKGGNMLVCGLTNSDLDQFGMGGYSVNSEDFQPCDIYFKPDGTAMFVLGDQGNDISQYSLSSAWDLTTASFQKTATVPDSSPDGFYFSLDGTKLFVIGSSGDRITGYSLSTPWDIGLRGGLGFRDVRSYDGVPTAVEFKPDGTRMYFTGLVTDSIYQYDLATPWDVPFASSGTPTAFSVAANTTDVAAIRFKPDGTKMYLINDPTSSSSESVDEYTLSTAWDVTTATFTQRFTGLGLNSRLARGIYFKDDGLTFYVISQNGGGRILTYSIGEQ
jgi:sugar lactone lactonase YvrE